MLETMLKTNGWKEFCLNDLFDINPGKYHSKEDYEDGTTPYVTASGANNGIAQRINLAPDFPKNVITTGKVGCTAFYQIEDFCASSDVNIFRARKFEMNFKIGIFITSVINFSENYKWTYGRQCRVGDSKKIIIKLPVLMGATQHPIIDLKKKFCKKGYVPDFQFMEEVIGRISEEKDKKLSSLSTSLETTNISSEQTLDTKYWKEFYLHKLFEISMGNGIDANKTSQFDPKYNYVSRDSNGNGVVGVIDEISGESPFPAGTMSVALGGSFLGSCFVQKRPFYTAQNVAVLQDKSNIPLHAKLFISALIRNECKIKYLAFGRELNSHIKRDFTIKLPVKHNLNGIEVDKQKTFSEKGYIPDWEFMDKFMRTMPFGDRI